MSRMKTVALALFLAPFAVIGAFLLGLWDACVPEHWPESPEDEDGEQG